MVRVACRVAVRPHVFSWCVLEVLDVIDSLVQYRGNAERIGVWTRSTFVYMLIVGNMIFVVGAVHVLAILAVRLLSSSTQSSAYILSALA